MRYFLSKQFCTNSNKEFSLCWTVKLLKCILIQCILIVLLSNCIEFPIIYRSNLWLFNIKCFWKCTFSNLFLLFKLFYFFAYQKLDFNIFENVAFVYFTYFICWSNGLIFLKSFYMFENKVRHIIIFDF